MLTMLRFYFQYLFIYVFIYLFVYLLKLEREKAQHAAEMVELEKKIAELKDQLHKARHGLQDEVGFLKSLSARKLSQCLNDCNDIV